ncbi:MAG: hypothetical protein IT366_04845 [Candidatus Hydrogenedentes bacterium]|nr:hypothetical protein [Candidatus Hydrogenedentota bacterium]
MSQSGDGMRRLPVYIVLEYSDSMSAMTLDALYEGLRRFVAQLRSDPEMIEMIWLSVIVYGTNASVAIPLSDVFSIRIPNFQSSKGASLGEALEVLVTQTRAETIQRDVSSQGDWGPLIAVIAKTGPTDKWLDHASNLKAKFGKVPVIGCAVAGTAAVNVLSSFCHYVIEYEDDLDATVSLFQWLAAATKAMLHLGGAGNPIDCVRKVPARGGLRFVEATEKRDFPSVEPFDEKDTARAVRCLVIMPFRKDFDEVFAIVREAAQGVDRQIALDCYWLKDVLAAGRITDDIVNGLHQAAVCVADVTENNPNVMWEAGFSMALGTPTILIGQNVAELPFDLKVHRVLSYCRGSLDALRCDLREAMQQTIDRYGIAHFSDATARVDQPTAVAVTGSMLAEEDKARRRIELLLTPYLKRNVLWYCGSNGVVDNYAVSFLTARRERVVAVGYRAFDLSPAIKELVDIGKVQFLDASVESVPLAFPGLSHRDVIMLTKSDLVVVFWDGKSKGTQAIMQTCHDVAKNVLIGFV